MTDRIEREVRIDAPIERVFGLVSEPGWWIEDGPERSVTREGEITVVELPAHGRFPVLAVSSDAPRYASFRSGSPGHAPEEGTASLVEFFLTEAGDGTVLRVVESGFATIAEFDVDGNIEGWETELAAAKRRAERVAV